MTLTVYSLLCRQCYACCDQTAEAISIIIISSSDSSSSSSDHSVIRPGDFVLVRCGRRRSLLVFECIYQRRKSHSTKCSSMNFLDISQQLTYIAVQALQRHNYTRPSYTQEA